jgi:hypothetical protein
VTTFIYFFANGHQSIKTPGIPHFYDRELAKQFIRETIPEMERLIISKVVQVTRASTGVVYYLEGQ